MILAQLLWATWNLNQVEVKIGSQLSQFGWFSTMYTKRVASIVDKPNHGGKDQCILREQAYERQDLR